VLKKHIFAPFFHSKKIDFMKVIPATLDWLPQLAVLFDMYRVFYQKTPDLAGATAFLNDRLTQKESQIFLLVSENEQKVMGFTQLYPLWSSTRMGKLWLLNDLFIHPAHRGQGYAPLLMERAKQFARETNAVGVMLETAKTNDIGNSLYPKVGFQLDTDFNWYHWTTV
jgi:GNAT superfamily N-acetyltransferase